MNDDIIDKDIDDDHQDDFYPDDFGFFDNEDDIK